MKPWMTTLAFIGVAAALAVTASIVEPERATPKIMSDQGEEFYPKFTDPQAVRSIEIVDYDEATATARPFQVEFQKGRWVLSANNNYPVEMGDRLVKTAGALMDLRKDLVRSDSVQDHAKFGVIDPLDNKVVSLTGRGKRVTLRDARKDVLADFILGKPVEGKAGFRYVRLPGQKRVYAVKTDADPSAKFSDWVNSGVVRIPTSSIRRISVLRYQVDERMGMLGGLEQTALVSEGGQLKLQGPGTLNKPVADALTNALANLRIVDARPKPATLAADLRSGGLQMTLETAMSLRQRGFFLSPNGRLLANEGETMVELANGVVYQFRFGEIATSQADVKPASTESANRYLFVTAVYDAARAQKYGDSSGSGERAARDLTNRFADWYYVISGADFTRLRPAKQDLVKGLPAIPLRETPGDPAQQPPLRQP